MASIATNNYTITTAQYIVQEATSITTGPDSNFIELTITPDIGYSVSAGDFSLINTPDPTYVSSVSFSQSGNLVIVTVNLVAGAVMPSDNLDLGLCIQGRAILNSLTIDGTYDTFTDNNIVPSSETDVAYSGSGTQGDLQTLFTKTFTANTDYEILEQSVDIIQGNAANYSIITTPTYDANGYMTSIQYEVKYLYPSESVSGDKIIFRLVSKELPKVQPRVITGYTPLPPYVYVGGANIPWTIFGEPGAMYSASMTSSGTTVPISLNITLGASGQYQQIIEFPEYIGSTYAEWTITITGDLANPFEYDNPIIVRQYKNIDITITAESSSANVGFNPSSEIIYGLPALENNGPVTSRDVILSISSTNNYTLSILPFANDDFIFKENISATSLLPDPLPVNQASITLPAADVDGTIEVGDRFNIGAPQNSLQNQAPFEYEITSVNGDIYGVSPNVTLDNFNESLAFFKTSGNISSVSGVVLTQTTPQEVQLQYAFTLERSGDRDATFTADLDQLIEAIAPGVGSKPITTCYAIKLDDMCCGEKFFKIIYIPTDQEFETAPMFYDDPDLQIQAAEGHYSINADCEIP